MQLALKGIFTWCDTDFFDLASLGPLWITPAWDIKNIVLKKRFFHNGGLARPIFQILQKEKIDPLWEFYLNFEIRICPKHQNPM